MIRTGLLIPRGTGDVTHSLDHAAAAAVEGRVTYRHREPMQGAPSAPAMGRPAQISAGPEREQTRSAAQ